MQVMRINATEQKKLNSSADCRNDAGHVQLLTGGHSNTRQQAYAKVGGKILLAKVGGDPFVGDAVEGVGRSVKARHTPFAKATIEGLGIMIGNE